jgi:serine phosphatase RsbU (regulator of sigma subunit)
MAAPIRIREAGLRLVDPELTPDELGREVAQLAVQLGLAHEARFAPGTEGSAPQSAQDAAVEIRGLGGALAGVLWCTPASDEARQHLGLLARHAGLALDLLARAQLAEQREASARRIAERLQDALLPRVPDIPHTTIAVGYRAAAKEAKVGGDFYDVFPLPCGRILLSIGDVMGKGVAAAAHTSRITQTMRALALAELELDELLERLDEQVTWQEGDVMATVWCGLYEPTSGELAFASLGHPPALLLRAVGDPIRLELEGLPLGMRDLAERPPEIRTRRLDSRDLLVLYTDGVVEASRDYVAGLNALLGAVKARREEPVGELLDAALTDMLGEAAPTDDAAMLLLRRS